MSAVTYDYLDIMQNRVPGKKDTQSILRFPTFPLSFDKNTSLVHCTEKLPKEIYMAIGKVLPRRTLVSLIFGDWRTF